MIGIFGGTFDPIHYGHLRVAQDVVTALDLEQLRFIPLYQAVHRNNPAADAVQRIEMLKLATADNPYFVADDREINRQGPSYTVDTLKSLSQDFPGKRLCLLVGSDAFEHFLSWRAPQEILSLAHIVVMQRPGQSLTLDHQLQNFCAPYRSDSPDTLRQQNAGIIYFLAVTQLEISATAIRQQLAAEQSVQYLLPEAVIRLIQDEKLYRHTGNPQIDI